MNVLTRTPQNTNLLQPSKYLITFDRIGSTQYFCQSVNLPGVSVGQAPINFPSLDVYAPGNKIAYNNFNIEFIVDEELKTWQQMYNWFLSFASPEGTDDRNLKTEIQNNYKRQQKKEYSDATLTILSALNNPILRIEFTNMFPVSLSDVIFDTKLSADDIVTADVTFVYESFKFVPITA
jgi:hypothetical protein